MDIQHHTDSIFPGSPFYHHSIHRRGELISFRITPAASYYHLRSTVTPPDSRLRMNTVMPIQPPVGQLKRQKKNKAPKKTFFSASFPNQVFRFERAICRFALGGRLSSAVTWGAHSGLRQPTSLTADYSM